jgi:hypothetical protein
MPTKTKKTPKRLISARVSDDAYARLVRRAERSQKKSGLPATISAVLNQLIEEHA